MFTSLRLRNFVKTSMGTIPKWRRLSLLFLYKTVPYRTSTVRRRTRRWSWTRTTGTSPCSTARSRGTSRSSSGPTSKPSRKIGVSVLGNYYKFVSVQVFREHHVSLLPPYKTKNIGPSHNALILWLTLFHGTSSLLGLLSSKNVVECF